MAVFYNRATLSYTGGSTDSNVVSGTILETLGITKTALSEAYRAGEPITYAINLTNTGAAPLTNLTVTDDLGAVDGTERLEFVPNSARLFVNGVLQPDPAYTAGANLVFTGIDVPAGGNALILYQATPNRFAPLDVGGSITNNVSATGAALVNPVLADLTLPVTDEPVLRIEKSLSPTTVSENGTLTYTFVISNDGNTEADAADAIVLSDTFNPILSNIAVSYNGTPWTSPAFYTYDENTGAFATAAGRITVPAATFTTDPVTGEVTSVPGTSTLTVTGTV